MTEKAGTGPLRRPFGAKFGQEPQDGSPSPTLPAGSVVLMRRLRGSWADCVVKLSQHIPDVPRYGTHTSLWRTPWVDIHRMWCRAPLHFQVTFQDLLPSLHPFTIVH